MQLHKEIVDNELVLKAPYERKSTPVVTKLFQASDSFQSWTVPEGLTKVHVECVAASGFGSTDNDGKGGRVECDLTVIPGQTFYIKVGKMSTDRQTPQYNATDMRTDNTGITDSTSLQSRIVVAGGGGCRSTSHNGASAGGNGGGLEGQKGFSSGSLIIGGGGGTQSSGGAGGYRTSGTGGNGSNGSLGLGGQGAGANVGYGKWGYGGAGGAGYYGGGGGGWYVKSGSMHTDNTGRASGGGGGSSYTDETLCENVVHTQGFMNGDGYVVLSAINESEGVEYITRDIIYALDR